MTGSYQYTPYIWPVLTSTIFLALLWVWCIRRRAAPGAIALSIMAALATPWVIANGFAMLSTHGETKILWYKFQGSLVLPIITAQLCFGIEYSGLGKWLTRRTLTLLAVLPLAFVLLIVTNENHHLVWTRIWFDGRIHPERGPAHWVAIGYGYLLSLLLLIVLGRLFARSPRHRWIVLGLIIASICMRAAASFNIANWNPIEPLNPLVLVLNFTMLPYAFAIHRFRMFEVVPVARDVAIECMADGLMVLDVENRIADVNKAAEALLGITRSKVVGRQVEKTLEGCPDLLETISGRDETEREVSLGDSGNRCWHISASSIIDQRGFKIGRLITFRNITEQKRARARFLNQERTLAMLKERELLARELHDGIGQMAAAAHLQVKFASELLARGDMAMARSCLNSLSDAIQGVKESVREYLVGVKTGGSSTDQGFLSWVPGYIEQYGDKYGIQVDLVVPPEMEEHGIDSTMDAQLRPILQEALINIRKHSGARSARVIFASRENRIRITIEDDGRGFDPETPGEGQGFGLRSMSGRARALGGRLEICSSFGKGTRLNIEVPWRKEDS